MHGVENPAGGEGVKRDPRRVAFPAPLAKEGKHPIAPVCRGFLIFPLWALSSPIAS